MLKLSLVARIVAFGCCALVAWQAFLLWSATGRAGFTRYHDAARAAEEAASGGVADLFEGTGLEDETGSLEEVPNDTALGALPGAYPWMVHDRHFVSLATLGVPAALAGALILIEPALRRGGRSET